MRALTNVMIDAQSPLIGHAPAGSWARINESSTATLDIDDGSVPLHWCVFYCCFFWPI